MSATTRSVMVEMVQSLTTVMVKDDVVILFWPVPGST